MKQTILVPTDFSNNSLTATYYAIELAKRIHADIHILHTYRPFTSAFQSPLANQTDEQRAQLGAEKSLADFMEKLDIDRSVNVTTGIVKSTILDAVKNYLDQNNVCLVVMGTRGASGIRYDVLGSNTYDLAKHITHPMLIVPEHAAPFKLNKVVFFTDYQEKDVNTFRGLLSLLDKSISLSCTLVHIDEDGQSKDTDRVKLREWQEMLAAKTDFNNLSAEIVHLQENVDSVNEILNRSQADLTILTLIGGKSFFEKLFHKSLARAIILNPKTPVFLTGGVE